MANYRLVSSRIKGFVLNLTGAILVLVPMFLIISSSVYPAIMSGIENKEMQIISKVMAKLNEKNIDTSSHHTTMPLSSSQDLTATSPTPVDPSFSATSTSTNNKKLSNPQSETTVQQQDEGNSQMDITSISSGKAVHTIWEDSTPGFTDIFYKRDGADFDPTTINLSNNAGISNSPAVAVSGNNVHAVWNDDTAGNFDILYRRSTDGGATFGPTINLSNNAGDSNEPAIAISGNNVHVVWHDDTPGNFDILYRRSTDGGASFTEPTKNLSNNTGASSSPAIAASGSNVHVVWNDNTGIESGTDILYKRSINGGSTFPNIIKNLSDNAGTSTVPAIAISGNNVHVVWHDDTPGNFDILYRRSLNNGETFPNIIKNLSDNAGNSFSPAIAVSGNNVHVVWQDDTPGNLDILYKRSLNNGDTFSNIKNLSGNNGFSTQAAISLSGNNIYVVWHDFTPGNSEILYRTSANNGGTFPSLLTNLSANAASSFAPAIAAS